MARRRTTYALQAKVLCAEGGASVVPVRLEASNWLVDGHSCHRVRGEMYFSKLVVCVRDGEKKIKKIRVLTCPHCIVVVIIIIVIIIVMKC